MNHSAEFFTRDPTDEFLNQCRQLVGQPDKRKISQDFESHKWQIRNLKELEKSGELPSRIAEQSRSRIQVDIKWRAYNRVADYRITKGKLAQVRAVYRRAAFGDDLEIPVVDEDRLRRETLSELNDLWREIIVRHQVAALDD